MCMAGYMSNSVMILELKIIQIEESATLYLEMKLDHLFFAHTYV